MAVEEKSILRQLNSVVILLTSIVALGTGIFSLVTSINNKEEILAVKSSLSSKAEKIKESFSITYPLNKQKVDTTNFPIQGVYNGELEELKGHKLWIITYDKNGYNRIDKEVNISANHKWFHDNVYYSLQGTFKILVVLTNNNGSEWIKSMKNKNPVQYTFEELHPEAQILDYIELEKI